MAANVNFDSAGDAGDCTERAFRFRSAAAMLSKRRRRLPGSEAQLGAWEPTFEGQLESLPAAMKAPVDSLYWHRYCKLLYAQETLCESLDIPPPLKFPELCVPAGHV